jgi:hypothetical protein
MRGRGCIIGWGCWVQIGGTSKYMQTMPEVVIRWCTHCWACWGGIGGGNIRKNTLVLRRPRVL